MYLNILFTMTNLIRHADAAEVRKKNNITQSSIFAMFNDLHTSKQ